MCFNYSLFVHEIPTNLTCHTHRGCCISYCCSEMSPNYAHTMPRHVPATFCFFNQRNILYIWNNCIAYYWQYLDAVILEDYKWNWVKSTELTVFLTSLDVVRPVTRVSILIVQQPADTQLLRGSAVPTRPVARTRRFVTKDAVQPVTVFCWYRSICGKDEVSCLHVNICTHVFCRSVCGLRFLRR